jgi:hypothetical protein
LQKPSHINGDNFQSLRLQTSRTLRKKEREYFRGKIPKLETNNKKKILESCTDA